jgi:hypothetical protein
MRQRKIVFSHECDRCAERLGGYEAIDRTLDGYWDALMRDPYQFSMIESDWFSARHIVTKPIGDVPPLVWLFVINDGDVTIYHVEEYEGY